VLTDPIADMLTRVRNANLALHDTVEMPASKLKVEIARLLEGEGYIAGWSLEDARVGESLMIRLKYSADRRRVLSGLRRVSKPGRRIYVDRDELPRVLGGMGIAILSTNQGLMTDREARERRVGGEVLCQVW
jgi:small subunit ribosomal protein S8